MIDRLASQAQRPRPNPSLQPTCYGLRPPHAAELKSWHASQCKIDNQTMVKDSSPASPPLVRVILYVRDMEKSAAFYERHFGFQRIDAGVDDLIHLESPSNGLGLMILQAAKSVKLAQAGVKLVFQVEDIEGFKAKSAKAGLKFGATHSGPNYAFANAKDPSGNSVQISSRRFGS